MRFNIRMWGRALREMPRMSNEEYRSLDFVSRWLISTRFAAIIMTVFSVLIAGILAYRTGPVNIGIWALMMVSLVFAHATNNIVNDLVDFAKGVDRENYFRDMYGPQPLERGLRSRAGQFRYALVNGLISLAFGLPVVLFRGGLTWPLIAAGAFFVLFYTYPLKYFALGEISLLVVWGPLMVGGGYYVLTNVWDWNVVMASLPFALGVTATLMGKHIDKYDVDRSQRVFTLPVVIGEKSARVVAVSLIVLEFVATGYLVITGFFTPVMAIVLLSLPSLFRIVLPMYRKPRPADRPESYPENAWPLWFVASAFVFTRRFGAFFVLGLIADTIIHRFIH